MGILSVLGVLLVELAPAPGDIPKLASTNAQSTRPIVRAGVYQNAPKIFWDASGQPAGFWVDVLEPIAQAEGWQLEYVPCDWEQCLQLLEQQQLDLMVDVAYSEERDRRFDFNEKAVFVSWSEIYTRRGMAVDSLLDLDGRRVAVLTDSIQQAALEERAAAFDIRPQFVEVDDFRDMFVQLEQGRVDAGIANRFVGVEKAARYNAESTNIIVQPVSVHVAAPEGEGADLLAAIDRALLAMEANPDSAYAQAQARWLEPTPPLGWVEVREILLETLIYSALIGLLVVSLWNRKLKREIDRRQEAEIRLDKLADNLPGVIFGYCLHPDGSDHFFYLSPGFRDVYGFEPEIALQDSARLWACIHPDDLAYVRATVAASQHTLDPWQCEHRIITPDGQVKWLQGISHPTCLANGNTIWDGLMIDISDRKRAEAQTTEMWQRLELATRSAHLGIWDFDVQENRLIWDDRMFEIYGIDPTEFTGTYQDWERCLHPDDLAIAAAALQAAIATTDHWQAEFRVLAQTGDTRHIEAYAIILRDEAGQARRVIGVNWDVSDRNQAEAALRRSEQRFHNMAANVPGAIFQYVLHPDGSDSVIYMSPGCFGLWEVEAAAVVENASVLWAMVHPDDLSALQESVQVSAQTLQPWFWQWRIITPSGRVKWLESAGRPVLQENGDVIWDSLILDVSDRKQAEAALTASELCYRKMVEVQTDFITRSLPNTRITFANASLCRAVGLPAEAIIGKTWQELSRFGANRRDVLGAIAQLTPENPRYTVNVYDIHADGQGYWTQWLNEGIFDESGKLMEIQSVGRDITELKQAEQALKDSQARLRLVTENMRDLVCLHDLDGRYLYVTPSSQTLLGYAPEEMLGRNPYEFFHPDDHERIHQESHQRNLKGEPTLITYRIRQKGGRYIWLETLTQIIYNDQGQPLHLQTASRDVSDRVRARRQLEHDALHDSLTGLPNRSLLMARLQLALQRTKCNPDQRFAVLFLDLDNFKVVNDSLGHLVGDELLLVVAAQLSTFLGDTDLAARLGGDEFVILLEDITEFEAAVRVAEQILAAFQVPFTVGDRDVFVSTSIGILLGDGDHHSAEDVLRDADLAMYRAKQNGRGGYALFDPVMHWQMVERLHLENDLRRALEQQEFVLYYQPIVSLETLEVRGFEALIRWQHPQRGIVSPVEFVPVIEEMGLVVAMGRWVLLSACRQAAAWQAMFPQWPIRISVNLSVQQLQPALLEQLDQVLQQTGLPGDRLVLEITEGMLIQNIEATCDLLEQLKQRGIHLSIDDFGTGYSSLRYLHQLPVDTLKIDRSFVSPAVPDARSQVIAESIVALSNLLELKAIAEGIETLEQLAWLQAIGCEMGQGYLFATPLTVAAATTLLQRRRLSLPGLASSAPTNPLPAAPHRNHQPDHYR